MRPEALHSAFFILEKLAALCATEGVDEQTKKEANLRMQELLSSVVKSSVTSINASASGIVTME